MQIYRRFIAASGFLIAASGAAYTQDEGNRTAIHRAEDGGAAQCRVVARQYCQEWGDPQQYADCTGQKFSECMGWQR